MYGTLPGVYDESRPECSAPLHDPVFTLGSLRDADISLVHIARVPKDSIPGILQEANVMVDCVTVLYFPMQGTVDQAQAFPEPSDFDRDYMHWAQLNMQVKISIRNANPDNEPVELYYLAEGAIFKGAPLAVLKPDESMNINSYVGHIFFTRLAETHELVDWGIVEHDGPIDLGIPLSNQCGTEDNPQQECEALETTFLRDAFDVWFRQRVANNGLQPSKVQKLTNTGFELHHLPAEIYAPLKQYWEQHQDRLQREHLIGPAINQLDSPTFILDYPYKDQLFEAVKPMLEEWSHQKLTPTSCYGIRKYTDGNRLLVHVDTIETHA